MTFDIETVERETMTALQQGHRVFQVHRFAEDDMHHVRRLALWADLPRGSYVVDMGSGVGEVARIWQHLQPDVSFCLVNISPMQLELSPPHMPKHCCDMLNVPEEDETFDAAICCFAIGHVDCCEAFREMARLVRSGGVVFVYDMVRVRGDNARLAELAYRVGGRSEIEDCAEMAGLDLDVYLEPSDRGWYGPQALGDGFGYYFGDVKPAIWRFRKS